MYSIDECLIRATIMILFVLEFTTTTESDGPCVCVSVCACVHACMRMFGYLLSSIAGDIDFIWDRGSFVAIGLNPAMRHK